jgi:hypothetical protein
MTTKEGGTGAMAVAVIASKASVIYTRLKVKGIRFY